MPPEKPQPPMHQRHIALIGTVVFVIGASLVYQYQYAKLTAPDEDGTVGEVKGPPRTDYGTAAPTQFPKNIPIEAGTTFNQSYSLDYGDQEQLTAVFPSAKSVTENYALYAAFLTEDGWTILNKHVDPNVSSLYGIKEGHEINVTVAAEGAGSQVSVSVLKKE